ncbi:MAG: TrmH family RNA methyltransferase [Gammaproteobacteria bacterium]|nr:TrmH family RNA methyltransferase [Gammaproteobacteria bacterium]
MMDTKILIGLINPKSPDNVNSVMRAAGNFRVNSVFYTGTRYPRAVKLHPGMVNMSRKVSQNIPLTGVNSLFSDVVDTFTQEEDMKVVCVEFAENAIALPAYQHPENALYILGPEDGSITQDVIDKADDVVYIPTNGCMNIAATVNVVLYDRLMKAVLANSSGLPDNNILIRENRDLNNRLKVS